MLKATEKERRQGIRDIYTLGIHDFSKGCSKCRYKPGSAPSCHKQRADKAARKRSTLAFKGVLEVDLEIPPVDQCLSVTPGAGIRSGPDRRADHGLPKGVTLCSEADWVKR